MQGSSTFILTHLVVLMTFVIGSTLASAQHEIGKLASHAKTHVLMQSAPTVAAAESSGNGVVKTTETINDYVLFAWAFGGSMLGAYIGIAVGLTPIVMLADDSTRVKWAKASRGFVVSLVTGILVTPYVTHTYLAPCRWSTVFLLGGCISAGAWIIWNIFHASLNKFLKRAETDGVAGVIAELKKPPGA